MNLKSEEEIQGQSISPTYLKEFSHYFYFSFTLKISKFPKGIYISELKGSLFKKQDSLRTYKVNIQ